MKLCIVSDSHDRADALSAAVTGARQDGAEAVIHCGDVIGIHTLRGLKQALAGTPVAPGDSDPVLVQHIVRSFDPCMVCTVH